MKTAASSVLLSSLIFAGHAFAHVGIANNTLPISAAGQAAFTVANTSSEILFLIPHGCTPSETQPVAPANLDTTRIEITVPAAIVAATTAASLRPSHSGEFGLVERTSLNDGGIKFTWTKNTAVSAADDQLYKVSIRLKTPAVASASDVAIKKYQFPAIQTCSSAGVNYVMDWGLSSPTLLSFPEKRKGFNQYSLDASTVGDFSAASGTSTLTAKLKSYFGDAAILWVNKRGYSPNANTLSKIDALANADRTYSNLAAEQGTSLSTSDIIWVKY
ncbi:MAG TPA: hypothetical protein VFM46_07905 [Pseudomonadales bacterium]|nr:hypothetical protein [Pseudomonadales bacterium]